MDHYWWSTQPYAFGMFNSTDQYSEDSKSSVCYSVINGGKSYVDRGNLDPPSDATVVNGIMLPDNVAREYGLL